MKKFIIAVVVTVVCCGVVALAKSKSLQPDTYAYTRGVEAYNEANYADAIDWFERELSEHPDNGYAYMYISTIRYDNHEYGLSLSAINEAIKRLPKKDKAWRSQALLHRSAIYTTTGDTVKAYDDLSQAIKIDPTNSDLYSTRAQLYYEQSKYEPADADYRKMIDMEPGNVVGYMGLGRNAHAQGRWDEAIARYTYVTKMEPDYSSGFSYRAETYIAMERWPEAADDIIKALDIDADNKAFRLISVFPKDGYDILKSKFKIQMTKEPTEAAWPYYIAIVADSNNEYDEAITYYEKANTIDANFRLLEYIARCYVSKKEYTRALDYVERALAMDPEDDDLIGLKADILSYLGRFDECLVERDRYVAKNPELAYSYYSRADDRMSARRYDEAIEDYNTVTVIIPSFVNNPYILMRRGDAYRLTGKIAEATKEYEALLEVEKDSVMSYYYSCTPFAYSGLGNADKAIDTMQYIVDNDTTDITGSLYNMACIYGRLDRKNEAIRYLREAIDKGYDNFVQIEADYDMDCLRNMPEYQELLKLIKPDTKADDTESENTETAYTAEVIEVPFTKEGGVTKVKCAINGLPLHFVFDTGAAEVTMSMVEANFMLKNDYIKPEDFIGSSYYVDANGDISEGSVINLRNVNFGGLELDNVRASVVRNQRAPLLLGQSVLGRLGKIEIDNPGMKLVITHKVPK